MTIKELIDHVREVRPNSYGDQTLYVWINEIEGAVQTEVLGLSPDKLIKYTTETSPDTKLLADDPHAKLYTWYLIAMLDLVTMGSKAYENSYRIFNTFWNDYARWYLRTHRSAA